MIPDRRDTMLLRLAGKYRWLPYDKLDKFGFDEINANVEMLSKFGLVSISRNRQYINPTPRGYRLLNEHSFDCDIAAKRPYANSTTLRRRLEASEIMLTALRAGIDTLQDDVDALQNQPVFLPAFAFRSADINMLNNCACAGFGHWGNSAYMLHYISPESKGMFLTNELRIFHNLASVFSAGLKEHEAMIFAGDSYKHVFRQIKSPVLSRKHGARGYVDFAEVYKCTGLPIHLLSCSVKKGIGLSDHTIVFGATGSGKSRGYVIPFIFQAVKRRESIIAVDPKGELFEKTSEYLRSECGYTTKIFNLLDPENSDGWNSFADIESNPNLVDSIAEVIIKNTSNVSERQDFWEKAEKNLLQALMHYVQSQKIPGTNRLLPIEQRSLGAIYRMLSNESFADLDSRFEALPKGHPAKAPYGIFKLANRQIWGNIAIGLGNRLSVFQNTQMDKITAHNDIDLTLPGRQPCVYYCVFSAQDSQYEFLSSLFFSCLFTRLTDFARREGINGRLPVCVNFLLEEFCNIGKLVDFKKQLAILRGFNINCQVVVQSVAGLADRYEKKEWEEIISHCDTTICLGVNDLMTAQYISDKCGSITIRVDNNQMPLMPLFSPVYSTTRSYSQTRSNTKRALMMPDEIMRIDNKKCIVLLRGQKPLLLDKIVPEEFPAHAMLKYTKITEYRPIWREEKAPTIPDSMPESASHPTPQAEASDPPEHVLQQKTHLSNKPDWRQTPEYTISSPTDRDAGNPQSAGVGLMPMEEVSAQDITGRTRY